MRELLLVLAVFQFVLGIALSPPSLAQEWQYRRPRGTLKVVDLWVPSSSAMLSYAESLVTADNDNRPVACLAEDWRWIDERTIEFKLREGVRFHNGERFNAEAVRINWEEYRRMNNPRPVRCVTLPDDTAQRTSRQALHAIRRYDRELSSLLHCCDYLSFPAPWLKCTTSEPGTEPAPHQRPAMT